MTIFSSANLAKTFNDVLLFEAVSFGLEEGDRAGIIGKNGIGKTTLIKIIAGLETPDEGEVVFNSGVAFEYLDQSPKFDTSETVLDCVKSSRQKVIDLIENHKRLCRELEENYEENKSKKLQSLTQKIDNIDAWNFEGEAEKILSKLGIDEVDQDVRTLSGGMKKRVALAKALLSKPDLLILDEPTNHLDADSVQWLQDYLTASKKSLLFITHDRYFLDAVATKIVEIDKQKIFTHPGNYEQYLERKENYLATQHSTVVHQLSRLRTELAWLQKGAKARRSKQKSKVDWIEELRKSARIYKEKEIKIELGKVFLGSRIIEAQNISKSIGGKTLFENFTYVAKPKDRIGVIGPNGSGKSTLLNVLSGEIAPDDGTLKIGASINCGFFRQEITDLKDDMNMIGALREIADYIDVGVGRDRYLSVRDMLERFLFPPSRHKSLISTLSGGEKRRLALLRVLMNNPNVLLLDEPTNDFDIQTLNAFEDYLENFYGVLIVVSHDRAFLDRTVNFILAFDGKGNIKEYPGNYSNYLEKKEERLRLERAEKRAAPKSQTKWKSADSTKKKLSYMEQREFDRLEKEIPALEKQKADLQNLLNSGKISDYKELERESKRLVEIEEKIDGATARWFELSESVQ